MDLGLLRPAEVDLLTIADFSDKTDLKTENVKLNAQITPSNSATGFYFNSDKVKIGRNAGPTRAPGDHLGPGPLRPDADRLQGSRTPRSSARTSTSPACTRVNGGFELAPEGGLDATSYSGRRT